MHYVKQFNINGVATKQVACIELQGAPNAATEGSVGVLGMDMTSPTHDVYRCVAVNGSVYTWELLSAGMSIISAKITGEGGEFKTFPYDDLLIPERYLIKVGDLIIDSEGYLYQIKTIGADTCDATYAGTHIGSVGCKTFKLIVKNGKLQLVTESGSVLSSVDYMLPDESTLYRNAETGMAQVRGIKTINEGMLRFFVGTRAEYDALANKNNVFALLTDDDSKKKFDNISQKVEYMYDNVYSILSDLTYEVSSMNREYSLGDMSSGARQQISIAGGKVYVISVDIDNTNRRECMTVYVPYYDNTLPMTCFSTESNSGHWCRLDFVPETGWYFSVACRETLLVYDVRVRQI